MGYNTILYLSNDAFHAIDSDPAGWWEKTKGHIYQNDTQEYGFGNCCNHFQVVSNQHADATVLIAAGQNCTSVIGVEYYSPHHTKELQIKLLEQTLKRLKKELQGNKK